MAIRTSKYEVADLRHLLAILNRVSSTIEDAIAWQEQEKQPLFVFNAASQIEAAKRIAGFEAELFASLAAARAGKPYGPETLKPRANVSGKEAEMVKHAKQAEMLVKEQRMEAELDQILAESKKVPKRSTGQSRKKKSG